MTEPRRTRQRLPQADAVDGGAPPRAGAGGTPGLLELALVAACCGLHFVASGAVRRLAAVAPGSLPASDPEDVGRSIPWWMTEPGPGPAAVVEPTPAAGSPRWPLSC